MKKILFCLSVFTLIQSQTFAALPPFWQDVQELKVILADKRLGEYLNSGDAISAIKKTEDGWVIITNKGRATIKVNYEQSERPGPAQFRISFMEG